MAIYNPQDIIDIENNAVKKFLFLFEEKFNDLEKRADFKCKEDLKKVIKFTLEECVVAWLIRK